MGLICLFVGLLEENLTLKLFGTGDGIVDVAVGALDAEDLNGVEVQKNVLDYLGGRKDLFRSQLEVLLLINLSTAIVDVCLQHLQLLG